MIDNHLWNHVKTKNSLLRPFEPLRIKNNWPSKEIFLDCLEIFLSGPTWYCKYLEISETPRRYLESHNTLLARFRSAIYTCIFFYEIQKIETHMILMNSRGILNDLDHSAAQGFSPDSMALWSQKSKCLKKQSAVCIFAWVFLRLFHQLRVSVPTCEGFTIQSTQTKILYYTLWFWIYWEFKLCSMYEVILTGSGWKIHLSHADINWVRNPFWASKYLLGVSVISLNTCNNTWGSLDIVRVNPEKSLLGSHFSL